MSLCKTCRPTFAEARAKLIEYLRSRKWTISGPLKVMWAESQRGIRGDTLRFWFKPQAVWFGEGNRHTLGDARSTHDDIRDFTPEEFLARNGHGY